MKMTSIGLKRANSIIGDYVGDSNYTNDDDPNKAILLWTTKFHEHLNNILRTYTLKRALRETTWTKKYLLELFAYYKAHAKNKQWLIEKGIKTLYRGYKLSNFTLQDSFRDDGFISTSQLVNVAKDFQGSKGNILCFDVSELSDDCIFVYINDDIEDHLNEEEILFPPGRITLLRKTIDDENIKASYEPNSKLLEYMKKRLRGGHYDVQKTELVNLPKSAFVDMNGKLVVWYRAIKNRPIDVLTWHELPLKEAGTVFMKDVLKRDKEFSWRNEFIPEYSDLLKKQETINEDEYHKLNSYTVFMAIIDREKKSVLDVRYGIPSEMFKELYDTSRDNEIEEVILKKCAWLMK